MKYLRDASLIIISVLLAFILNEWRTDYKEKQDTINTLDSIRKEIVANKYIVDTLYSYHNTAFEKMKDSIRDDRFLNSLKSGKVPEFYEFFPNGILQDHISTIAYEIATHKNLVTKTIQISTRREI